MLLTALGRKKPNATEVNTMLDFCVMSVSLTMRNHTCIHVVLVCVLQVLDVPSAAGGNRWVEIMKNMSELKRDTCKVKVIMNIKLVLSDMYI